MTIREYICLMTTRQATTVWPYAIVCKSSWPAYTTTAAALVYMYCKYIKWFFKFKFMLRQIKTPDSKISLFNVALFHNSQSLRKNKFLLYSKPDFEFCSHCDVRDCFPSKVMSEFPPPPLFHVSRTLFKKFGSSVQWKRLKIIEK